MTPPLGVGLCSITLRAHAAEDIVALAVSSGIAAIEWGAVVHVPPGSPDASALARRCRDAGIATPSYGSYLLMGGVDLGPLDAVLDTTEALGARTVRVWAPFGVMPDAEAHARAAVVDALATISGAAAPRGLRVALEFHPGTLTHDAASANRLLDEVGAPNLFTYWQPETGHDDDARCVAELAAVVQRVAHVHAFSWGPGGIADRRPLASRDALWREVLALVVGQQRRADDAWGESRVAYLEYVEDDDPANVARDAAVLRELIAAAAA